MECRKDLKILEEIIKISESIALIHDKLKELEKNNQLNSDEYLKNIDYIRMLREDYENPLYQSLDLKKIKYLISYLKTAGLETMGDNVIHSLYPKNRVNKRVINTLFYHMAFAPSIIK